MKQKASPWRALTFAAIAGIGLSKTAPVAAQTRDPWRFSPSVAVDETWSDNINLSSSGTKQSEFVTTISPSLSITRLGPWLSLNFNYAPQFIYYARGSNGNSLRNALDANLKATLIQNLLTFDANANISQQNISPFGTQAANTVNGSQNRAESRSFSFGPTLQSRLDRDLTYSAGYRYSTSSAGTSAYAANHTNTLFGDIETSTSFRDLGVGANINRSEQDYGNDSIVTQSVNGTVRYVVTPTFHLRGSFGYDRNHYSTATDPDLTGPSYSGGFDWQPSHHTSLNAQVGHRYFGPTANISLSETMSRVSVSATYTRDQSTSLSGIQSLTLDPNYALLDQFYRATITDPVARQQQITQALLAAGLPTSQYGTSTFLTNQLFVSKTASLAVVLLGMRNTVSFDATRSVSQSLSTAPDGFDIFDLSQRFRSTSYSANWSYTLGPRTHANATIQKSHNVSLSGTGDSRQLAFTASINRAFQQKLTGTLLYRHTMQSSDSAGQSSFYSGNYRENSVLGSLRLNF